MSKNLQLKQPFQIVPQNVSEAMELSKMIANSDLAPKDYKGKPGNVLIAIQMGAEVGLAPMQAIQNIAVINGRPSVWGDALLAIVQTHPDYEWIKEEQTENEAICTIKRRNHEPHTVAFTLQDAVAAGLDKKPGTWQTYRKRMMQMRARGWCIKDVFADATKGLIPIEEAVDIEEVQTEIAEPETKSQPQVETLKSKLAPKSPSKPPQEEKTSDSTDKAQETQPRGNERQKKASGKIGLAIYEEVTKFFNGESSIAHDFIVDALKPKVIKSTADITKEDVEKIRAEMKKMANNP